MRHFTKHTEPTDFSNWKSKYPAAKYSDLRKDRLFPGAAAAKWALRASLLSEQKGLCCYCESRIISGNFHVEHFKPKGDGLYPELQLEYSNLHACCGAEATGGDDEHCGHKKGDVFSSKLVSPLDTDCTSHFKYDTMGGIIGTDENGTETIKILNLDSALPKNSRKSLIDFFEDLEKTDFEKELRFHLDSASNPLGEYYSMIEYLSANNLLLHK